MDASLIGQLYAGSPVAIGVALAWVALGTRRQVLATVSRLGARIGRLEQDAAAADEGKRLEKARRWQLETVLLKAGFDIPPWPDLATDVSPPPRHSRPDWSSKS